MELLDVILKRYIFFLNIAFIYNKYIFFLKSSNFANTSTSLKLNPLECVVNKKYSNQVIIPDKDGDIIVSYDTLPE